ncbi:MAG TPA: PH domain-containing protein [Candidatus Acidoferrum sp.]|nr:PH domain-containing protein [Candidatus Acidoferrum sp.]
MTAGVLWKGRPWIFPNLLGSSVLLIVIAPLVSWLEFYFRIAGLTLFLNMSTLLWTMLAIFLVWLVSLARLVALSASQIYILRDDSLEVRSGIISSKSFIIAPTGFSDLEVTRSLSSRILKTGDITVRTQGEKEIRMVRVNNSLMVADRIREVMAKPVVRLERQETPMP